MCNKCEIPLALLGGKFPGHIMVKKELNIQWVGHDMHDRGDDA